MGKGGLGKAVFEIYKKNTGAVQKRLYETDGISLLSPFMNILQRFLALSIGLLIVAGCSKRPDIDPGATVLGGSPSRPDFVAGDTTGGDDMFGEGGLLEGDGLIGRDDAFGLDGQQRGFFPSVFFDFDQSFVRPSDRPVLDQVANHLRNTPGDKLLIEGHCDWKGTTEYNMALGDRRARSVMDYLVGVGIESSRIETLSKGDLEANPTADDRGRQQDRRGELILIRR